jgi:prolyl 4-hydroxylase
MQNICASQMTPQPHGIETEVSSSMLCESPKIVLYHKVVCADFLRHTVGIASSKLQPALVSTEAAGAASEGRKSEIAWLAHDFDPIIHGVVEFIADCVGMPSSRAEQLQVIRYKVGGEYRRHFDGYDIDTERGRRCTAARGQRLVTALLYLNSGFSGGNTQFPLLGIDVVPSEGSVLMFDNCTQDSRIPHPRSLHAGLPVTGGEKWVATLWFRER